MPEQEDPVERQIDEARKLLLQGHHVQSLALLSKLAFTNADDFRVFVAKAECYLTIGDLNSATSSLHHAQSLAGSPDLSLSLSQAYDGKALQAMEDSQFEDALWLLSQAIEHCPSNYIVFAHRAAVFVSMDRLSKARDDLEHYTTVVPGDCEGMMMLAYVYKDLGEPTAATACVQKVLNWRPENKEARQLYQILRGRAGELYNHGNTLLLEEKVDEAIDVLTKAIEMDPTDFRFRSRRAIAYRMVGRHDLSVSDLTHVIEVTDRQDKTALRQLVITYNELGVELLESGSFAKALVFFGLAIQEDPSVAALYVNRGDVHRELKDLPSALADYTKAHELQPNDSQTRMRLGMLHDARGLTYFDDGLFAEASESFSCAVKFMSNVPQYWCHLGMARMNNKEEAKALENFEKALELDPGNDLALSRLSMLGRRKPKQQTQAIQTSSLKNTTRSSSIAANRTSHFKTQAAISRSGKAISSPVKQPASQQKASDLTTMRRSIHNDFNSLRKSKMDWSSATRVLKHDIGKDGGWAASK